jgi:hypothetical protein
MKMTKQFLKILVNDLLKTEGDTASKEGRVGQKWPLLFFTT